MKLRAIATMILSTTALSATAGGFETNSLSTSFMYEKGNYAELGMSSRSPDVKGTVYAPTGSALAKQEYICCHLLTIAAGALENLTVVRVRVRHKKRRIDHRRRTHCISRCGTCP